MSQNAYVDASNPPIRDQIDRSNTTVRIEINGSSHQTTFFVNGILAGKDYHMSNHNYDKYNYLTFWSDYINSNETLCM